MSGQMVAWENLWAVGLPQTAARTWSLRVPALPRRGLAAAARVAMGAGLGALFAFGCGNAGFWVVTGTALGAVFSFALAGGGGQAGTAD